MTTVRKQKSGDQLQPGDWLAPGELLDGAAEVLHVLAYKPGYDRSSEKHVHLVVREQGAVKPYADVVGGYTLFDLATEADLAVLREHAERAQKITDIRALATWLEDNPWAPMPNYYDANAHLDARHPGGPSTTEAYAKVREVAARLGVKAEESLDDRTTVSKAFGPVTYQVIAWHSDGRPAEPKPEPVDDPTGLLHSRAEIDAQTPHPTWPTEAELKPWESLAPAAERVAESVKPADPLGLDYTRADDEVCLGRDMDCGRSLPCPDHSDDPTPVSPARVPPHTGGMTDEGLVDETPGEPAVIRYFSFGHGQTDPADPERPDLVNHYVTVFAPTAEACREAMLASRFGREWAFEYVPGTPQANEWIAQWTEYEAIDAMPKAAD